MKKNQNKNTIDSSYLVYLDKILNRIGMSKKLPVDGFEWVGSTNFTAEFIRNYEESSIAYFLKVDLKYSKHLGRSHNDSR